MELDEDSDLSFLNTSPLVNNVCVYIGAFYVYVLGPKITCITGSEICVNKYQLKKVIHHVIIQSKTVKLHLCARNVCFYCSQRAPGIGLKDRMHSSRY